MTAASKNGEYNALGLTFVNFLWYINNIRVRVVAVWVAALIGIILATGGYSAVMGLSRLVEFRDIWHRFDTRTANKLTLLAELRQEMGFGGLVHHFYRTGLTGDAGSRQAFQKSLERLRAVVPAYRVAGVNDQEERALAAVLAVAAAYEQALPQAGGALFASGAAAAVDDRAAVAGMETLASLLATARRSDADRIDASVRQMSGTIIAVFALCGALLVVLAFFLSWFTRTRLVKPMYRLRDGMVELSRGRRDITVADLDKHDEIGDMARALQVFKDNADIIKTMEAEKEEEKRRVEAERRGQMLELADQLDQNVKSTVARVAECAMAIKATAESMSGQIGGGANRSIGAVEAAQAASGQVAEMASSAERLVEALGDVLGGVRDSAAAAGRAVEQAGRSRDQVRALAESAARIGEVVQLINEIAEKTNLLALNATIEAARAGDAGKGFAVVATEVKQLANQTTHATNEIAAQVGAIQQATKETVASIEGIGESIRETSVVASRINDLVIGYGESTREIANESRLVSEETDKVAENIVSIAHTSASTCGASIRVIWAADDLFNPINDLEREVNRFLEAVRNG